MLIFAMHLRVFHFVGIQSLVSLSILSVATFVIYLIDRFYYYGYSNFIKQISFLQVASCSALIQPTLFIIIFYVFFSTAFLEKKVCCKIRSFSCL